MNNYDVFSKLVGQTSELEIHLHITDMMTPKVGLASVLVLVAVTQLASGMTINNFGVEKCEPSIIPRSGIITDNRDNYQL